MPGLHGDILAELCGHPGMHHTRTTSYSLVFGFQTTCGFALINSLTNLDQSFLH